jgi:hypothetical protein
MNEAYRELMYHIIFVKIRGPIQDIFEYLVNCEGITDVLVTDMIITSVLLYLVMSRSF